MSRQLFFDVTELSRFDKGTGIQRVTRAVLYALVQSPPVGWSVRPLRGDSEAGRFVHAHAYVEKLLGRPMPGPAEGSPAEAGAEDVFLTVDLTYNIVPALVSQLELFKSRGTGIYCVVHDLIPLRYPQWFEGMNDWFEGNDYLDLFRYWLESFARLSDGLIGVSHSVEKDVGRWLDEQGVAAAARPKLGFFHHGCDIAASAPTSGLPEDAHRELERVRARPAFLMVGTVEPRKGYALALDAFELLWSRGGDLHFVMVGRPGWKVDALTHRLRAHPEFGRRLFWFEGISDEYLRELYLSAQALLSLSEAEGFGLPNVEAGAFGVPVMARDIEVFREVCPSGTSFVRRDIDAEGLADAVSEWMQRRQAGLIVRPAPQQGQTWRQSTRQLMSVVDRMGGYGFEWKD